MSRGQGNNVTIIILLSLACFLSNVSPTRFHIHQTEFLVSFFRILTFAQHAKPKKTSRPPPLFPFPLNHKVSSVYLNHRMTAGGRFDGPSTPLRLIMSSMMLSGLNLDAQLILIRAAGQRPIQRRQSGRWHAEQ